MANLSLRHLVLTICVANGLVCGCHYGAPFQEIDGKARADAEQWFKDAEKFATPEITKDQAVEWLRERGSNDVGITWKYWKDEKEIKDNAVIGSRTFVAAIPNAKPARAEIKFWFNENSVFLRVEHSLY